MKNLLFAVLFLSALNLFAQNPLKKGGVQINAGLGFSNRGLPVYAGFDIGVHQDVSIGAEGSYRSFSESYYYVSKNYKYEYSIIGVLVNGNYHFTRILKSVVPINSDWDIYAGLNIGFYIWSTPSDYHGDRASGLGLGAQVGARYFFNKSFGLNLEFGGGNATSGGKFGITLKF